VTESGNFSILHPVLTIPFTMARPPTRRPHHFRIAAIVAFALASGPTLGQTIEVAVMANGGATKAQPLPVGATPVFTVTLRNGASGTAGPIKLVANLAGLTLVAGQGWRVEGGDGVAEVAGIAPGERVERTLPLKVDRAPLQAEERLVRVEARWADGKTAAGEIKLQIADCVGAYRERLATLRTSLVQKVRDAAEETRRPDPALPGSRLFAPTGARGNELRNAERLAASFAARRGGDAEMATEWFRFMIARWISELNAYASQGYNPGLCANNYYQIAGYRQGLLPITKRIETIRAAALDAAKAAREATGAEEGDNLAGLALRATQNSPAESLGGQKDPFSALAAANAAWLRERKLSAEELQRLSLIETAAWLDAADRRAQTLAQAIDTVLSNLASAQKESCICSQ
jgi:hypothetical protein